MRKILALVAVVLVLLGSAWALGPFGGVTYVTPDEPGAFGFHPGELVADFTFEDMDGKSGKLSKLLEGKRAVVIAIRTVECPVSQRYGHRLAELEAEYGTQDVAFLFLDVSPQDTPAKIREDIETFGFQGRYVADPEGDIGALIQAKVSTEIFVIDESMTLRYRGAVDDQFGITYSNPKVRNHHLRNALDQVLDGKPVDVAETEASGCYLEMKTASAAVIPQREITYHNRVSRILQENCVGCHREDGGVAPMAFETYEQAYGFHPMIRFVVDEGLMPPWYANPDHGVFKNDPTMSERDLRDLRAWIDAGAPEGDPSTATSSRNWVDGWDLSREPDVVIEIPEDQFVPASGVQDYRYVYVKTHWEEDKWVQAMQPLPTAPDVTHHIIAYLKGPDDENIRGFLSGYAPGVPPWEYDQGLGKKIPAGAWLMFELHYTPNGTEAVDRTKLGIVFADEKPDREVVTAAVSVTDFEIPPHAAAHQVVATQTFRRPGEIIGFLPHMHLRGKSFKYEMLKEDGSTEVLLDVPAYDFNWQLWYETQSPIRIEEGTTIRATAVYDNSSDNPANPDPEATVRYGEQTFEEMMFGFYDFVPDRRARSADSGGGGR